MSSVRSVSSLRATSGSLTRQKNQSSQHPGVPLAQPKPYFTSTSPPTSPPPPHPPHHLHRSLLHRSHRGPKPYTLNPNIYIHTHTHIYYQCIYVYTYTHTHTHTHTHTYTRKLSVIPLAAATRFWEQQGSGLRAQREFRCSLGLALVLNYVTWGEHRHFASGLGSRCCGLGFGVWGLGFRA